MTIEISFHKMYFKKVAIAFFLQLYCIHSIDCNQELVIFDQAKVDGQDDQSGSKITEQSIQIVLQSESQILSHFINLTQSLQTSRIQSSEVVLAAYEVAKYVPHIPTLRNDSFWTEQVNYKFNE